MQIRQPSKSMEKPKELKVKLPVQQHLQLHALKLMTGKNISDAVKEALDTYLGEVLGSGTGMGGAFVGASTKDEAPEES